MADFPWTNPTPNWVEPLSFDNYKDLSSELYKDVYSSLIKDTLSYFASYPSSGKYLTWDEFNQDPEANLYSTVTLTNSDFATGTVRLVYSAKYVLGENIIFEPNPNDNFMPTPAQMEGPNAPYPKMPYGLGFFAALTIEGDNICLDLNDMTLRQSQVFNVQQRFYANIELASAPFIPGQGPAHFGPQVNSAKNCFVGNGFLALSSHHGIHGNDMEQVVIQNVNIAEYEVAGIALNGGQSCLIRNVNMCGMSSNVRVLSTYSAGRFIGPFLQALKEAKSDAFLDTKPVSKTIDEIILELDQQLNVVLSAVQNGEEIPDSIFKNKSGLYDGGGYGLVLNARGVVVGPFRKTMEGAIGNIDMVAHDISIVDAHTGQGEIVGVVCDNPKLPPQYGGCMEVGPAGSVLQVDVIKNEEGRYVGNVVSNAKIIIGKYKDLFDAGTTNITPDIVGWAESTEKLNDVLLAQDPVRTYISGGDSMGHTMKGYIHVFLSGGKDLKVFNITAVNGGNEADPGVENVATSGTHPGVYPLVPVYNGSASRGLCVATCERAFLKNMDIDSLQSRCGNSCSIDLIGECKRIRCRSGTKIRRIVSGPQVRAGGSPNPPIRPLFINKSVESKDIQIK